MRSWIVAGALLAAWALPAQAQTVSTPSNLRVAGTIKSSATVTVASGNSVYAVVKSSGASAGTGSVMGSDGTYLIDMSKEQSFNGTALLLRITVEGKTYKLMESASTEAEFTYTGGFPFPATVYKDLTIGVQTSSSGGGGSGGGGSSGGGSGDCAGTVKFDANKDGVSNQADIDYIKSQLGSKNPVAAADINGDGRVTVIDAIIAIKASAGAMRGLSGCPAKKATTTTGTSTTGTSTTGTSTTGTSTTGTSTTGTSTTTTN